jgi:hypothetical protein
MLRAKEIHGMGCGGYVLRAATPLSLVLMALLSSACGEATGHVLGGLESQNPNTEPTDPLLLRVGICGKNSAQLELIDDMEDGNASLIQTAGHLDAWFAFNDESPDGVQSPAMGMLLFRMSKLEAPRGSSLIALRTVGSGFLGWGAGVGFDFVPKQPYDASRYAGIAFWARIGAEGDSNLEARLNVNDRNTSPYGEVCDLDCQPDPPVAKANRDDGVCDESRGPCWDDFGADFGRSLNGEWQYFSYPWALLKPANWSLKNLENVTAEKLYGVRFQTAPNQTFDLWIDDVSFLCR